MQSLVNSNLKIVVIGGGTGSFTLLRSLKDYTRSITALVTMADDGGSTGVLRDELGVLPPGDVRQCLVALSGAPELRDLFNYRFEEGGLKGHAFGNLFLTALEKTTGDFARGVEVAGEVLNITGTVEPMTLTNVILAMRDQKGTEVRGEFAIGDSNFSSSRPELWLEPKALANPKALAAIAGADLVVIAPGNLYGSLAPALIVPGVGQALMKSKALKVYVCNLVTKPGQTDGFGPNDFADEIERFTGEPFLDAVLFNTEKPEGELLEKYEASSERVVTYDHADQADDHYKLVGARLLSNDIVVMNQSDPLAAHRAYIRHDSQAVASALMDVYESLRP